MDIQFIFLVSCLAEKLKKIMKKMCLWCSFNNMDVLDLFSLASYI